MRGGYAVQLPHIRQRTPGSHNTRHGAQRIVDGGNGIGRAFQENHGKAILSGKILVVVVQTTRRPASAMRRARRVHERRLAPGPHKRGHPGKGYAAGSGKQGFKRPTSSWLSEQGAFFQMDFQQVSAAGVTPEMRPAWPRVRGRTAQSFSTISADRPETEGVIQIRREADLLKPCGALDQLVLPHQIARVLHGGLRLQKGLLPEKPSRRDAGAQAVPASWTDA